MTSASADAIEQGRIEHARHWRRRRPHRRVAPRRAYEQLRSSIRVGSVRPDEQLAETLLGEQLGVSRNSIRAALQMLAVEGLVERRTKTGTRLSQRIVEIPVGEVLPRDAGEYPAITVQELGHAVVRPPETVRVRLGIPDQPVLEVEQLAVWQGEPLYVRTGYLPLREDAEVILARMAELHADLRSFTDSFRYLFGRPPGRWECAVEAIPAVTRLAGLLELAAGRPVLLRELVMYDDLGAVREFSYTHLRGDRAALSTTARH
ncbi:GntR family transcriptional regulator [Pseudonocardia sp. RS010]|uniref:GntR family transcriptional regulator n=1 Tax=Pseudonocardia sp. RS010 TaxID=3385979 RepID=UPI0039A0B48C